MRNLGGHKGAKKFSAKEGKESGVGGMADHMWNGKEISNSASYQRSRGPGSRQQVYHMAYGGQQSAGARQIHVSAARSVRSDEVGNYDVHREHVDTH